MSTSTYVDRMVSPSITVDDPRAGSSIPPRLRRPVGGVRPGAGVGGDELIEAALGSDRVDEPPVDGLLTLDPFGAGGEHVGQVAADESFVDDPGQAAGAGENGEQRDLGQ